MKPEIKKKWLNALHSGKYKQQCEGKLQTPNGYCCLGVLCDLYAKENNLDHQWTEYDDGVSFYFHFQDHCQFLPPTVIKWSGLSDENPVVKDEDEEVENEEYYVSLAELNDDGYSFEYIANLIESQL